MLTHFVICGSGGYRVVVLSDTNGHHEIVEIARGVCQSVMERRVRVEQVDTPMVTNTMESEFLSYLHIPYNDVVDKVYPM